MAIHLNVTGKDLSVDADPSTPLLWVLCDHLAMTGTKYGCDIAKCGACTVPVDGVAARSCNTPVSKIASGEIDGPQCGYCQSGEMMATAALLAKNPKPSDGDIDDAMDKSAAAAPGCASARRNCCEQRGNLMGQRPKIAMRVGRAPVRLNRRQFLVTTAVAGGAFMTGLPPQARPRPAFRTAPPGCRRRGRNSPP